MRHPIATAACFLLVLVAAGRNSAAATVSPPKPAMRVQAIAPPLQPLPAEAVSAGVTRFSFIVYGDTRGRRDGKDIQYEHSLIIDSVLATIKKLATNDFPVRFVLQTGDAVVDGRDPQQWNNSFIALINRITTEGGVPYFLAPGNHDVSAAESLGSTNRLPGLRNYLSAMEQLIPPDGAPRRLKGYPTYAFGYGNSFFIALDSNIASDPTQYKWISRQLEGIDRTRYLNVFAFMHHPPFSSGPHGGAVIEKPAAELRQRYMPLFRRHHLDAIFSGHEHLFEHWVERYEDRDGRKYRLDEIVTGGGGAPLYTFNGEPDTGEYLKTYETEKVQLEHLVRPAFEPGGNPYHYVVVRVDGERLHLEVVGVDWGSRFRPYRSNKAELD